MADGDAPHTMVSGFPPAERADWLALAGDLSPLRSTTYDGIPVEPLYTADDDVPDPGLPGLPPYVRGRTAASRRAGWDIRQIVRSDQGRGAAVAELEHGATSLWLHLDEPVDEGRLGDLLDGVVLDAAPVVLDAGRGWWPAAEALAALWANRGADADAVHGSFGADPYGAWAADRRHVDLDGERTALVEAAASLAADHRHVRVATVDATRFHDSGASDATELGLAVAVAVATVRDLTDAGGDLATAFGRVELRLAASVDQFATIAKFRAARRLLALVAEVAGEPTAAAAVPLHAVTSRAMATSYDSAVNMLRATIACFAAGVGGADAVTVHPYDELTAPNGTRLGRRLARNTQLVLALESNLAKVLDPAGGSWYVERLTEQLAERAWDVVREVESAGGFRAAVETGIVDRSIADTRSRRTEDIDRRRATMVGVTVFPDIAAPPPPPVASIDGDLPLRRWAEDFEALRRRVDTATGSGAGEHDTAVGGRPAVFLAAFGAPAACTPRLAFAANFFGIAGLETPRGPGDADLAEIATAFAESGAPVACVCADDGTEQARGPELRDALTAAGATRVYSAAELGGDVHAELADLLDHVGIP